MIDTIHIKANLAEIKNRIASINPDARLIAVSKTFPVEFIKAAIEAGHRDFGESKIQEALPKIENIGGIETGINWHFIGHLQTNKASKAAGRFSLIQSVDSLKIAEKISDYCSERKTVQEVLVELNPAGDSAKTGILLSGAEHETAAMAVLPGIKIAGIMAMAPYAENAEEARPYFRQAASMFMKLKDQYGMNVLSMGMSNDFEIALQEGANMVRVGTAIFGGRNYGG